MEGRQMGLTLSLKVTGVASLMMAKSLSMDDFGGIIPPDTTDTTVTKMGIMGIIPLPVYFGWLIHLL